MILVVCALLEELRHVGRRPGVELFACGVGPVEAAIATACKLAREPYAAVINAGIAGGFPGRAAVGGAVLIVEETLAGLGLEGGEPLALPGGATLASRTHADPGLVARCAGLGVPTGRGLTVSEVTTTDATALRHGARYGADVESMEGFSVLRAAALARVPALEIRGISNRVGDRASSGWDFAAGARATAAALALLLDRLAEELP